MNRAEAQKLSDAFMGDLVAEHVDNALGKMASPFSDVERRAKSEAMVQKVLQYCGRPLEYELRHDEVGRFSYKLTKSLPMRAFYYGGKTTDNPKGACYYVVRVVQREDGMRVANFGPLKVVEGKEPAWAK
jgi:hypothetical protein